MRKNNCFKFMVLFVLCISIAFSLSSCSERREAKVIEQRIFEFQSRCNSLDIEGILRCIEPSVSEPIVIILKTIDQLSGSMDKYDILSKISSSIMDEKGLNMHEFFKSFKIEIKDITSEEGSATVDCYISYSVSDIVFKKEAVINLKMVAEVWYISSIDIE